MPAEERSHARLLQSLVGASGGRRGRGARAIRGPPPRGERQRAAGGRPRRQRRAAVELQPRDGRRRGARSRRTPILVTGLAGLLAGAGSMAMGEWISVKSARELSGHQLEIEAREIDRDPRRGARGARADLRGQGPRPPEQARALADAPDRRPLDGARHARARGARHRSRRARRLGCRRRRDVVRALRDRRDRARDPCTSVLSGAARRASSAPG